jgi:hopanoid-associated phosphorylase
MNGAIELVSMSRTFDPIYWRIGASRSGRVSILNSEGSRFRAARGGAQSLKNSTFGAAISSSSLKRASWEARPKVYRDALNASARSRQTVIVVVGLAFEARIAAGAGTHVICGGNSHNLAALLGCTIAKDCRGLISFGFAGGLSPDLPAGTCIVGSDILSGKNRLMTDRNWSQNLLQAIPNAIYGTIVGASAPVACSEAKRALHAESGAVAVDMESYCVASMALAHDLPFAAIRVITDPAERTLPQVALSAMRPNGTINIAAVIRSLVKRPSELSALLQITIDTLAAYTTLRRARWALGSVLGRVDANEPELDLTQGAVARSEISLTAGEQCPLVASK